MNLQAGRKLLDVTIPGNPPTKERARTFQKADGGSRTVTPKKTRTWEKTATAHFRLAWGNKPVIRDEPVALFVTAIVARPASMLTGSWADKKGRLPCLKTPDIDNIEKIVMDALAPSRTTRKKAWICVLNDDAIVVDATIQKRYAAIGEKAHTRIELFAWQEDRLWPEVRTLDDLVHRVGPEGAAACAGAPGETDFDRTLVEAREALLFVMEDGGICPCCDQFVKRYRRKLNATMARGLIWLVKASGDNLQWIHVNSTGPSWLTNKGGTLATLVHWGLIEEKPKEDKPSASRTSGSWRPTLKGVQFAKNELRVPSHVVLYNDQVEGWSGSEASIVDALGKRFHYGELMSL